MLSGIYAKVFRRGKTDDRRQAKVKRIEELGFELVDLRGWHEGKLANRRYHLVNRAGKVFDNYGDGFGSLTEAVHAAEKLSGLSDS